MSHITRPPNSWLQPKFHPNPFQIRKFLKGFPFCSTTWWWLKRYLTLWWPQWLETWLKSYSMLIPPFTCKNTKEKNISQGLHRTNVCYGIFEKWLHFQVLSLSHCLFNVLYKSFLFITKITEFIPLGKKILLMIQTNLQEGFLIDSKLSKNIVYNSNWVDSIQKGLLDKPQLRGIWKKILPIIKLKFRQHFGTLLSLEQLSNSTHFESLLSLAPSSSAIISIPPSLSTAVLTAYHNLCPAFSNTTMQGTAFHVTSCQPQPTCLQGWVQLV